MKKIADGHGIIFFGARSSLFADSNSTTAYQTPATIDDPDTLDEIEAALVAKGYAKEREEP